MGKDSGTTNTNTIQKTDPWGPLQQYLLGQQASAGTAATPGHYTMGGAMPGAYGTENGMGGGAGYQTWVPGRPGTPATNAIPGFLPSASSWYDQNQNISPDTLSGYNAVRQRAIQGSQYAPQEGQLYSDTLSGKYLDPSTNPYLKSTYDTAARQVANSVNSQFASSGRYGSGAQAGVLTQGLGDLATNIYGGNYQQERARQAASLSLAPQFNSIDYQNLSALTGANQAVSDYPYQQLARYGGLLGQVAGQGGSSSANAQQPYFTNQLAQLAGLGLTGASLYSLLGGAGAGAAAAGTAAGASGLASGIAAFSDRRLKTNISRVGQTDDGIPLYRYRYKWSPTMEVGVMAQDVEKIKPYAVKNVLGYKAVDYSQL